MSENFKKLPFYEKRYDLKKVKRNQNLKKWFQFNFNDSWYLYALILGCFGIMVFVLIHRKLTKQKGKWCQNLNTKNIYLYSQERLEKPSKSKSESKGEIECRTFLETVFQAPFPKTRPDFLRNPITGNNLEIDCFNPSLKLGVEYNGQQHYSYTSFFHQNKEASFNQKYRDELKRRMCEENGINLIEVPYTVKLNDIGRFLNFKLKQLGYLD